MLYTAVQSESKSLYLSIENIKIPTTSKKIAIKVLFKVI